MPPVDAQEAPASLYSNRTTFRINSLLFFACRLAPDWPAYERERRSREAREQRNCEERVIAVKARAYSAIVMIPVKDGFSAGITLD